MKKIDAKMAIKIALQFLESGKIDDATHVLEFYEQLRLDGDVIVTMDESTNRSFMPLGFEPVDKNSLKF